MTSQVKKSKLYRDLKFLSLFTFQLHLLLLYLILILYL